MKEAKTETIKFRLTEEQKEQIDSYCRKHNLTVSEFVRYACAKIFAPTGVDEARVDKVRAVIEKSKELREGL